jgi:hypothetical protein
VSASAIECEPGDPYDLDMSPAAHIGVLALVVLDLALGGALVHRWAGRPALIAFEFAVLLGYAVLVLGFYPFRKPPAEP